MKKTWKKGDKFKVTTTYNFPIFGKLYGIIIEAYATSNIEHSDFRDREYGIDWYIDSTCIPYIEESKETTKFDEGKPDFTLMPQEAMLELAKVFTLGASKYQPFNYSLGTDYRRYIAASQRHINKWLKGEDIDEIGTNHLANAAASLLMALDNQLTNVGNDNRNKIYKSK